jgi:hypothetical protein
MNISKLVYNDTLIIVELFEIWSIAAKIAGNDTIIVPRMLEACDDLSIPYLDLSNAYYRYAKEGYSNSLARDLEQILEVRYDRLLYAPAVLN